MMLEQIAIGIFGLTAIWLSQDERASRRRWACIFGLMGQPFWLWSAWQAQQWGIFILSLAYAGVWWRSVDAYWIRFSRER